MSEDQAASQEPGPEHEPDTSGGDAANAVSGGSRETVRLWIRAAGYFVMCLGALTIYASLMWRRDLPGLITIGFVLAGASYVLAGQALSEGYSWPLPLAFMSSVFSPLFPMSLVGLFGGVALHRLLKDRFQPGDFHEGVSQNAQIAYGLWLAGVVLVLFEMIRRFA